LNFDQYTEDDIYRQFGNPEKQSPETESGETPASPEWPTYVVKAIDFLSVEENIICKDIRLIDFDQSFPVTSPPQDLLGTPAEWLAPEIAVGHKPSPASDVWALGCCLFRLRAGECPFTGYEVTSPGDLMRVIIQYLGDIPNSWGVPLFDFYGRPTQDPSKGKPLTTWFEKRTLKDLVDKIWDQPENGIVHPENAGSNPSSLCEEEITPFPECFSDMIWKPTATRIGNTYLHGYDDETDELLKAMPKISEQESTLFYDLLSKIFIYDPSDRITAADMLEHPWFHMDFSSLCQVKSL
jgi:serine/threonine-protein kinase SRPK3